MAALGALALPAIVFILFFYPEFRQDELRRTGIPTDAVITGIRDTGDRFNDQPQVELSVEVRPRGRAPYHAAVTMIISPVYLPQFQPGARVTVRVDPEDPQRLAVESVTGK